MTFKAIWSPCESAMVNGEYNFVGCGNWSAAYMAHAIWCRWLPCICLTLLSTLSVAFAQTNDELIAARRAFQNLELTTSNSIGWIFAVGQAPRLIWRDAQEVARIAGDMKFDVRWFDAALREAPEPDASGRWMASLEGTAPNGTRFRRSFTFYALPANLNGGYAPDLTIEFPNFPGPDAPPNWREHREEIERSARDFMLKGMLGSEAGAILISGIATAPELGHPSRYVEWATSVNDQFQLDLKVKLLGLSEDARSLDPPRQIDPPAKVIHEGSAEDAGVPEDAREKIKVFCQQWAEATHEPFVTLIARRGVIVIHEPFGQLTDGQPVGRDYRCWVASITKTVTALLFAEFVDQGRIDLDSPISTVFTDYPKDDPHVPTFRQLLNHTSGLGGGGDFGGMKNPHLENVILNAIDINEPGKSHQYTGLGFELAAKAMELISGKSAVRNYYEHLFEPLGFGDVVIGNASANGEFTAMELAKLGQLICNEGCYGGQEFFSAETFRQFLPEASELPGVSVEQGLGMHRVRHRRPEAPSDSLKPEDQLYSERTVGHGSFSGCILVVDPEQELVIVQARRAFHEADNEWYARFFQTIAAVLESRPR